MPPRRQKKTTSLNGRELKTYKARLCKFTEPFSCPLCGQSVFCARYENHCRTQHGMKPRLECVWCGGQFRWPSGEKKNNTDHLNPCARRFMELQQQPPTPGSSSDPDSLPTPVLCNLTHAEQRLDSLGYFFADPPPSRPHEFPRPATLPPLALPFQDASLNLAASCVQKYLELGDGFEWFHIMVRIPAYWEFMRLMDEEDAGQTQTLPFACWCNGGQDQPHARYRQHRHMIVLAPRGYFREYLWKRVVVQPEDRPGPHYRSKNSIRIKDAPHLVHVMGYLSHRKSECNFAGKDTKESHDNHFYFSQTLPRGFRLPLFMLWDNGLRDLLKLQCNNLKKDALVCAPLQLIDGKWQLRVRDIPGVALNTVLPVAHLYEPSDDNLPTPYSLHLNGGRKLYFQLNPDLLHLTLEAWLGRQAERGNCFHHTNGKELWIPRPFYQGIIRSFKPFVDRCRELEKECAALKEEVSHGRVERAELMSENDILRERCGAAEEEAREVQKLRRELILAREEIAELRKELADRVGSKRKCGKNLSHL